MTTECQFESYLAQCHLRCGNALVVRPLLLWLINKLAGGGGQVRELLTKFGTRPFYLQFATPPGSDCCMICNRDPCAPANRGPSLRGTGQSWHGQNATRKRCTLAVLKSALTKLGDSPANLIKSTGVNGHTTRSPPGSTHPSKSRTQNLWIFDPPNLKSRS